jgi:serine beta-lactamase-like protein LACTB
MIKKIVLGLLATILVLALLLAGYVFSIKADRETAKIEPISVLHDQNYQTNAVKAEEWLKSVYQEHLFPSFSVAVGIRGELVWEGVIGFSDLKKGTLANRDTEYRIGSISKPMTATAVMRMQEKQIVSINDSFNDCVKDYPPEHSDFTLKQLLTHQGGVRHYVNQLAENFSRKEYSTLREAVSIVEDDALLFRPGEGFCYSTYGYTFLSLAMESAYSIPFEHIMHNEVFIPAGMQSAKFDKAERASKDKRAKPYLHIGDSLYKSPEVNLSYKYAGGGYLSTPSDVVRFGNALLNNSLLTAQSKEMMWSPVALDNGDMNPENYALGFRVGQDQRGRFVHHGGKSVGGYAFLLIYPESGIVIAFASNVTPSGNSFDRLQEAQKIARLFVDEM